MREYGEDDMRTAHALHNAAGVHLMAGQADRAVELYEQASRGG